MRSKICAALIAASFAVPAFAGERITRMGKDEARFFDSPCVSAQTLARIPAADRKSFSKAQGIVGGQKFFGCWRPLGNSVYILWEDGDQGIIPNSDIKDVVGL